MVTLYIFVSRLYIGTILWGDNSHYTPTRHYHIFLCIKYTVTWYCGQKENIQGHTVSGFRIFPAEQSKYSIFDFRNFGLFMGPNEGFTSYCTFLYITTVNSTACTNSFDSKVK